MQSMLANMGVLASVYRDQSSPPPVLHSQSHRDSYTDPFLDDVTFLLDPSHSSPLPEPQLVLIPQSSQSNLPYNRRPGLQVLLPDNLRYKSDENDSDPQHMKVDHDQELQLEEVTLTHIQIATSGEVGSVQV